MEPFKPIDLNQAVKAQYGANHRLVQRNLHAHGWSAVNLDDLKNEVLPIIVVPYDFINRVDRVNNAVVAFNSMLIQARNFFKEQAGVTFEFNEPVLVLDVYNGSNTYIQWSELARTNSPTARPDLRFKYYNQVLELVKKEYPIREDIAYVVSVYCGDALMANQGAGDNQGNDPPILPPSVLTHDYGTDSNSLRSASDRLLNDLTTCIHELGHHFGLDHPMQNGSMWGWSIMSNATIPNANLFPEEIEILKKCRFLR